MRYLLVILLIVGCSQPSQIDQSTPESSFKLYMEGVNEYDDNKMYSVSTDRFKAYLVENKWDFRAQGIERIDTKVTKVTDMGDDEVELLYRVELILGSGETKEAKAAIILKKLDGKWFIDRLSEDR